MDKSANVSWVSAVEVEIVEPLCETKGFGTLAIFCLVMYSLLILKFNPFRQEFALLQKKRNQAAFSYLMDRMDC